jgi:hypothetical protein
MMEGRAPCCTQAKVEGKNPLRMAAAMTIHEQYRLMKRLIVCKVSNIYRVVNWENLGAKIMRLWGICKKM